MRGELLLGWPQGLARGGSFDVTPVVWAALVLVFAWAAGVRLRWWSPVPALVAGLVCATISGHFGLWAPAVAIGVTLPILRFVQRIRLQP